MCARDLPRFRTGGCQADAAPCRSTSAAVPGSSGGAKVGLSARADIRGDPARLLVGGTYQAGRQTLNEPVDADPPLVSACNVANEPIHRVGNSTPRSPSIVTPKRHLVRSAKEYGMSADKGLPGGAAVTKSSRAKPQPNVLRTSADRLHMAALERRPLAGVGGHDLKPGQRARPAPERQPVEPAPRASLAELADLADLDRAEPVRRLHQ